MPLVAEKRRKPLRAALSSAWQSAACLLLLLSACAIPGSVRPTVKIGLVAPFEGRYRYVGYDLFPALRWAVQEANASAAVTGYAVEWVAYDDAALAELALQQAAKLAVDPEVVVVIGHFREETTQAAAGYYEQVGLPLLAPTLFSSDCATGDGVVFPLGPPVSALAAELLYGVETAALVGDGGSLAAALPALAEQRGVRLTAVLSPHDCDWLEALLADEPPVVICTADPVTAGEVVARLRQAGWSGEFRGGPELAAADFAAVGGEAAEGSLLVTPWPLPGGGESEDFAAAYRQVSGGVPPGPLALPAYEATRLALDALAAEAAASGSLSRERVAAVLTRLLAERQRQAPQFYWYRVGAAGGLAPVLDW
ncbi:MAG: ABC transporter substrate-binding protein [Anaerolineae bacterium]|nr:ABC transporter substrate-binding protein [Anaerolineae bacterium]